MTPAVLRWNRRSPVVGCRSSSSVEGEAVHGGAGENGRIQLEKRMQPGLCGSRLVFGLPSNLAQVRFFFLIREGKVEEGLFLI